MILRRGRVAQGVSLESTGRQDAWRARNGFVRFNQARQGIPKIPQPDGGHDDGIAASADIFNYPDKAPTRVLAKGKCKRFSFNR